MPSVLVGVCYKSYHGRPEHWTRQTVCLVSDGDWRWVLFPKILHMFLVLVVAASIRRGTTHAKNTAGMQ